MDKKNKTTLAQLSGRHHDLSQALLDHMTAESQPKTIPVVPHQKYAISPDDTLSSDTTKKLVGMFAYCTQGIVVLDRECKIQFMNESAVAAISAFADLNVSESGFFSVADYQQQSKLRDLVSTVISENDAAKKTTLEGSANIVQHVQHVTALRLNDSTRPYAIVCLENHTRALFDHQLAQSKFGLSRAEIAVCQYLASGVTVQTIANKRGTSKETVRYQLKSIYAKTHTNSQHSLVSLLLTTMAIPLFKTG